MSDRRRGVWQLCRLFQAFLAVHLLNAALPAVAGDEPARRNRADDAETIFELEIRPVLAGTCFKCHGDKKASHGLRTDSRESLLRGGESGPAIIPGNPEKSLLIHAIRYSHADLRMPPDKRLPEPCGGGIRALDKAGGTMAILFDQQRVPLRKSLGIRGSSQSSCAGRRQRLGGEPH